MEWVSELFAEIEIVAAAKTIVAPPGETVAHSWLPWLTRSPRFCHVAHVPAGTPLIFLGAIDAGADGEARAQMKAIFERIGSALFDAGSSYRHLAKATYYLHAPPTRALLGEIRGVYFDPARPPSASALQVAAPPRPGRAAAIELIAVPVK
jgi:enamine deaminase RidA (YjgF/YER057c/UK114 family)